MIAVNFAAAGTGLFILFWYALKPWWKSSRDWQEAIMIVGYFSMGAVSTICGGGVLGWLAGCTVQGSNTVGETATGKVTGTESGAIALGSIGELTPDGAVAVFIGALACVVFWKSASKADKKKIGATAIPGVLLSCTAGAASLLGWIPAVANNSGAWARGVFEGGLL